MEQWLLSLPIDVKLEVIRKIKTFGEWIAVSKVLLDAPLDKGGVQSDILDQIFKEISPSFT